MIDLIYFSWIRERIGKSSESVETKASTIIELIEELKQKDVRYSEVFSDLGSFRVAINQELTNFDEGSEGEIGFIQLGYALNNRTFSDLMVVLETINKNQRFDYINQLNVSKVNGSDERLNLSFTYTNLGLVLD